MRPVQSSRHLYSGQRALSGSKLLGDIQQLLLGEQHPEKIWERCWQDELYRHPTLLVVAPKIGLTHPSGGGEGLCFLFATVSFDGLPTASSIPGGRE